MKTTLTRCRFSRLGKMVGLCVLLCTSCVPQKPFLYSVVPAEAHAELYGQEIYAKYILIEEDFSNELKKLLKTASRSNYGTTQAKMQLQSIEIFRERSFLTGVIYLQERNFATAKIHFDMAAKEGVKQAEILSLDCQREIQPEQDYYLAYQNLYDSADDAQLKNLIKNRYQFYRHGL